MRYRFGDCVFDDARGALRRLDDVIALEPQVLVVLHYLLVHRQRVVSRDELLEQCWPQTYVSDAALTSCLRRVRQAIGQRQGGPTLIETLHRRGYRFVAEVIVVDEAVAVPPPAEPVLPESAPLPLEFPPAPVAPAAPQASAVPSAPTPSTAPPVAPIEVTVLAERRHLTVLSCTLAGADALSLPLDPEAHYDLMQTFYATTQAIVAPYAGHVVQQLDHGVVVYFGYPQAHEDDAQRAVRSGLGLVEAVRHGALSAFADARAPLTARVGIATGMMIVRAGGDTASQPALGVGSASTLALRLGALAQPGTVVISEATAQLVSDYFACKAWEEAVRVGSDDPQVVYEVHGESPLQTRLEVGVVYGLTPFVGREAEVALLRERWGYVHEGLGQVVVIRGEAGIGKSRLVQVLKEEVMGEAVMALECRCSPYHQHTAFYPLIDLLHRALQVPSGMGSPADSLERLEGLLTRYALALEETVPLLAGLLSLSLPEGRYAPLPLTPSRQRECTLETLVSLVLAQTEVSPLLLIVEDVHWADASTLEFLGLLLEQVSLVPLLVVLTCRPEFEPPWGQHSGVTRVVLNRLTQAQMETMIGQVAANKRLPDAVLAQVVDKTDGVPLFIEELTRMVVESGQLVEHEGHYELREALTHWVILGRIQRGSLLAAQG
jgi:DNA-binding winged helix-turn-helix (wHTH) protein/class 3 adenylate cyclase